MGPKESCIQLRLALSQSPTMILATLSKSWPLAWMMVRKPGWDMQKLTTVCPYLQEHLDLMQTPLGPVVSTRSRWTRYAPMSRPQSVGSTDLTVGYIASADSTPVPVAPAVTLVETSMNVSPHPGSTLHVSVAATSMPLIPPGAYPCSHSGTATPAHCWQPTTRLRFPVLQTTDSECCR